MKKYLDTKGVKLCYNVEGEGYPVILMHGWGCNHSTLASIESTLSPYMKVYNVDFPGFGESTEPLEVWGVEQYTQVIEDLVEAEKIECPVMLGHSFGGRVGIVYASRHDVRKLILTDAAGVKPRRSMKYYYKVYSYKLMKHLVWAIYGKEKGENRLNKIRAKKGSSDYSNSTPMMRAILSRVVNEDLRHLMPKIKCPTLLVWGESDTATPLGDAKIMEQLIPDAGLVPFPGCGHYSFLDNALQYQAVLRSFLKDEFLKKQ